jgi:hypothetical protein
MKEWKTRQQITNRLHEHTDIADASKVTVWDRSKLLPGAFEYWVISYFRLPGDGQLHYPQKSYAVALVYAKLLEQYFGESFYDVLDDRDLLLGDKYFVRYSEDRATYDSIIRELTRQDMWNFEANPISQVQATVRYFKKEFLLD